MSTIETMKFVVNLPLNAAQGSRSAAPMRRGLGNVAEGSHAGASSSVGDRRMSDEKAGSLAHTLFIQGCPGSFTCLGIEH